MKIYIVRRGDSLWSIARRYGVTVDELIYTNQIQDPSRLAVGRALVIPGAVQQLGSAEVNAYAYPNISEGVLAETLPSLSFLCPFSWQITASGELIPIDDRSMIEAAYQNGTAPLLTVTNIGANGGFSSDIAHTVFTDSTVQDTLVQSILAALRTRGYYGVDLNIEYVYPFDREGYNAFIKRMAETLHPLGYYLTSTVAPKESDGQQGLLYGAHDYTVHGEYCDRVVVMTYEWGYSYSQPQAVSPVDRMRRVLDYAVTRIPPGKLWLGFSNYGYDWTLPWKQGVPARVISNAGAANLADSVFAEIKFDSTAQAPYFIYTDPSGTQHEVWFEDARSVNARLGLVSEYSLAGISYWTINQLYRAGLEVLSSKFSVEKIV